MPLSIQIDNSRSEPLQDQIAREISSAIVDGRMRFGERLPGTRPLAEKLGVSRNTMINAYQKLISNGFLEARGGGGTFVSASIGKRNTDPFNVPSAPQSPVAFSRRMTFARGHEISQVDPTRNLCDFRLGAWESSAFPLATWRRLLARRTRSFDFSLTGSGESGGYRPLRESIARFLMLSRGIDTDAERVLIVTGIQQALHLVAQLFVRPGSTVVMEAPCCGTARQLFETYGATIVSLPVDYDGMCLAKLPETRRSIAFVTPGRQYPLGTVLSSSRQDSLIAWAERTDSYIVEVDFDGDLRYESRLNPAMQIRDTHERVLYIASFSSVLGTGLRIGYMIPPANLYGAAVDAALVLECGFSSSGFPWLEQCVLNDFIVSGGYESLLKRLRKLYKSRRDALIDSLIGNFFQPDLSGQESGTHLIWRLSTDLPGATQFRDIAARVGVNVYTLQSAAGASSQDLPDFDRIVLLGFAATPESKITSGIALAASALSSHKHSRRNEIA